MKTELRKKRIDLELAFIDSDEFHARVDPTTIGAAAKQQEYLRNRVLLSYRQGVDDGQRLANEELIGALEEYLQAGHKEARRLASERAKRAIAVTRQAK